MEPEEERRARIRKLRRIELAFLVPLLILAVIGYFTLGRVQVVGVSMVPTLHPGQRLTIVKAYDFFSPLQEGDIVTVTPSSRRGIGDEVIKRLIFRQNERGDRPWPETIRTPAGEYRSTDLFPPGNPLCPLDVPNGYYLLGDNIERSQDSREFGPVRKADIFGKVLMR